MVSVKFYDSVEDSLFKFAVIIAKADGKWVFCKKEIHLNLQVVIEK